jgi:hypothetical protein
MSKVTTSQVEKVCRYSGYARTACSVLLVLLGLSVALVAFAVLTSPGSSQVKFLVGNYAITADKVVGAPLKAWLLLIITVCLVLVASMIYLLRRMFDNMSRGEIFVAQNVRHVRHLAFIILATGALQLGMPLMNGVLLMIGAFEPAHVFIQPGVRLPGILAPFGVGLLIYLASWIMQVGLGVTDEAAELRRDAELVV